MNRAAAILLLIFCFIFTARGDWHDSVDLRGYVRNSVLIWKPPELFGINGNVHFDDLLHARQNFRWYPARFLTAALELKSRVFLGESAPALRAATEATATGTTYFDWNRMFADEKGVVWDGAIDRFWLNWTAGPLETTIGRQRIAWGTNFIWNPTDLFNPSSPLDFDNEEKPGTDAVRVQFYTGPSSKLEFAAAPAHDADSAIVAMKLQFNRWGYDLIALAGQRHTEKVIGFSWAGNIGGGGFRGELLESFPGPGSLESNPFFTASISGDYTFPSSLYLHSGALYSERGTTGKAGGLLLLEAYSRGDLSPSRLSLYGEIALDLSPLVRADLLTIVNPFDGSWYAGPALSWSVVTNVDLSATGLLFGGNHGTEFGDNGHILMLRLKWSY